MGHTASRDGGTSECVGCWSAGRTCMLMLSMTTDVVCSRQSTNSQHLLLEMASWQPGCTAAVHVHVRMLGHALKHVRLARQAVRMGPALDVHLASRNNRIWPWRATAGSHHDHLDRAELIWQLNQSLKAALQHKCRLCHDVALDLQWLQTSCRASICTLCFTAAADA